MRLLVQRAARIVRSLRFAVLPLFLSGCVQNLFYQPDRVVYDMNRPGF